MEQSEIRSKIKSMLVTRLNLGVSPDEIADEKPLFRPGESGPDDGLNLDSIEALEIVIGLERAFNIKIRSAEYRQEFYSVQTLAEFVNRLLGEAHAVA